MSENSCRIKLNDVSLVLGGELDCGDNSCGCSVSNSAAFITAYNTIEGTASTDGVLPLSAAGACLQNMTLENNSITVGCGGVYSVSYSVRLNPRLNVSVTLCRNGEILDGTILTSSCGMNAFSYSGIFQFNEGDVLTLMTDSPCADLAGETNVVLSLYKIA